MPIYLLRSPKGGLAIVSASSEMDAKLDLDCNCYGVEMSELTATELPLDGTKDTVVELHSFKDGSILI